MFNKSRYECNVCHACFVCEPSFAQNHYSDVGHCKALLLEASRWFYSTCRLCQFILRVPLVMCLATLVFWLIEIFDSVVLVEQRLSRRCLRPSDKPVVSGGSEGWPGWARAMAPADFGWPTAWPPIFLLNFTLKFVGLTYKADNFQPAIC